MEKEWLSLENKLIRLEINSKTGVFRCIHTETGERWDPDPWQGTLGYAVLESVQGDRERVNLSGARDRSVQQDDASVTLRLSNLRRAWIRSAPTGPWREKLSVTLRFALEPSQAKFSFVIEDVTIDSRFWHLEQICAPLRAFPVRTVTDDGFTLVPSFQGGYIPSRYEKGYFRYLNWIWETISGRNEHKSR
jgi:hypothetical protein